MSLKLAKLQKSNKRAQKFKAIAKLKKGWKDVNRVLYHQELPFMKQNSLAGTITTF